MHLHLYYIDKIKINESSIDSFNYRSYPSISSLTVGNSMYISVITQRSIIISVIYFLLRVFNENPAAYEWHVLINGGMNKLLIGKTLGISLERKKP